MVDILEVPTYNLGVVTQETGINPDTLRAWERRYGLPQPERSSGGHRLYSQRDIETVHWLMARQEEGMRISKAVKLWRALEEEGTDPLGEIASLAAAPGTAPRQAQIAAGAQIEELRSRWVAACMAFDEIEADRLVAHAFALYPAETVCFEILFAGLAAIGEAWYQDEATVQQEHFASGLVGRQLNALIAAASQPIRTKTMVVGCPPGEEHDLPALLITFLLRSRGWPVVYLGANVPLADLKETVEGLDLGLVILTAQRLPSAASLSRVAEGLAEAGMPLAYGGRIFKKLPNLVNTIPAHYLGDDIRETVPTVERILAAKIPTPAGRDPSARAQAARDEFIDSQPDVERALKSVIDFDLAGADLAQLNADMAEGIIAALDLGEIGYLEADLDWIAGYLGHLRLPEQVLKMYLCAYHRAAGETLGEAGRPITAWLERVCQEA